MKLRGSDDRNVTQGLRAENAPAPQAKPLHEKWIAAGSAPYHATAGNWPCAERIDLLRGVASFVETNRSVFDIIVLENEGATATGG